MSGPTAVFVLKFNPEGRFVFAQPLGGSRAEYEVIATVDETGAMHVAGITYSHDFPSATELVRDPARGIQFFARLRGSHK